MQLYAGLPIITNKITDTEKQGIPHHLLGCIGLNEQTWEVGKFVQAALEAISDIRSRGKLPILVGGTHYYTQSLLFHDNLATLDDLQNKQDEYVDDKEARWPILRAPTEELLEELKRIDPVIADRWHPNDRRKIQRSLEIYLQTGKKASETYAEQRQKRLEGGIQVEDQSGPTLHLRNHTLVFWVHTEGQVLKERLSDRVEKMLDAGLLDEVQSLSVYAEAQLQAGTPMDETRGIWVSIGYKEFKPYLHALSQEEDSADKPRIKQESVEKTKIATRQYAKRQIRWIRIKLLNGLKAAKAMNRVFLLDSTNAIMFDRDVVEPALHLTGEWLGSKDLPDPATLCEAAAEMLTSPRDYDLSATPDKWLKRQCELCGVTTVTDEQWQQHIKSRSHRRLASKQHRQLVDAQTVSALQPAEPTQ
ncbi:IPPT-domain-containing protein [Polychaeton citri CBS 116435]|uniref:tRNA dimethylallyltransferase n=1 Tax=Polychaeton citri CBS 116435 TaxID=1314669 RepID=A0A9P4UN04_9PEZI|nr:IPPT-domain-containing protein [Polychaeton citri CBS 116435]